jgi:gas vesicle protein
MLSGGGAMNRLRYVGVALVAGTVGAAVALLMAPDSGRNTRRRLSRRIARERQAVLRRSRRMIAEAEDHLDQKVREAARYLEVQVKRGEKLAAAAAGDAVEQYEQGKKKLNKLVR